MMKSKLGPVIEILLDSYLKDDSLQNWAGLLILCQQWGMLKNLEDALFGSLFTSTFTSVVNIMPDSGVDIDAELDELRELLQKRSVEIATKISKVAANARARDELK